MKLKLVRKWSEVRWWVMAKAMRSTDLLFMIGEEMLERVGFQS